MAEGVVAGIDWASEVHVACVMDGDGAVTGRFSFTHDARGDQGDGPAAARSAGVAGVAIERGDGPVVEELLEAGLAVFVVPSRQIKGLRTRYGSAGNKDDRFDAYVLADTLRTDGHRWKPLRPDTERDPGAAGAVPVPQGPGRDPGAGARGSCARTWSWRSPARSACSPSLPARSAWRSCAGSRPRPRRPGCPRRRLAAWLRSAGYTGGVTRRGPARPADGCGTGTDRRRGRGPRPDHPGVRRS